MHGQFVWYELTTPDVDAAKKFYPRITGWGIQRFDNDYSMWTNGGVPMGGIFRLNDEMRQQGVPPNWMPYVESDDVDATADRAASLGGTVVVAPADIPGTGRFAVLQDPQGATFGVYKSNTASGAWDGTPVVGRVSWHELMTTDHVEAFQFYHELFGWEKTGEMDMGGGNMYSLFGHDAPFGGMFNRLPEMEGMHPFWLLHQCEGCRQGRRDCDRGRSRGRSTTDGHPGWLHRHPGRPARRRHCGTSCQRAGPCRCAREANGRETDEEVGREQGGRAREEAGEGCR